MDSLAKLFGSPARLKILRLFIFNEDASFTPEAVAERTNLSKEAVRDELGALVGVGVLKKRGERVSAKYQLDQDFAYLNPLATFVRETTDVRPKEIVSALRRAGTLQVVALSGHFTGAAEESQVDLLIVGDNLEERALSRVVKAFEAEFGREIRYASFSTDDFRYRLGVYDRLLRDVFDYPHRVLIDKLGL